ncbi:MAG: signal recognition particle protein [Myxococcales bacterium]|nr:MAG: signal recognition particle protein [Myxococcales bacterium]
MFDALSDKLAATFKSLRGRGKLSEQNIEEAVRDVRMSFLEADVNFKVVKQFIAQVKEQALGETVMKSLSPGQQFIKVVYDNLVEVLGGTAQGLDFGHKPPICIMLVGLQGSGKTTSIGKLARYLKSIKRRPYLVPADVYRPAAIEQLKKLAEQVDAPVYPTEPGEHPVVIAAKAKVIAETKGYDTVLIDTAGRLQIDEAMMAELQQMKRAIEPHEILFVADAMTGQEAVNVAEKFNADLDISGVILTKMDGDARGGAALSIKAVTGKPLKFVGVGEKLDGLEVFHPDRMASRILGMGDVLSLIEKAQDVVQKEEAEEMQKKFLKANFTLEDFYKQMQLVKRMGSMSSIFAMIPGMKKVAQALEEGKEGMEVERELKHIEAIIMSMTPAERHNHEILNGSRRRRIAAGSGTTVQDVNRFIKQFMEMRKMMKKLKGMGPKQLLRQFGQLGQN